MTKCRWIWCKKVCWRFREPCREECRTVPWRFCDYWFLILRRVRNPRFWRWKGRCHRQTVCFLTYIYNTCLFWDRGGWYWGCAGNVSLREDSSKKVQFIILWRGSFVLFVFLSFFWGFRLELAPSLSADIVRFSERSRIWLCFYDPWLLGSQLLWRRLELVTYSCFIFWSSMWVECYFDCILFFLSVIITLEDLCEGSWAYHVANFQS